MVKFLSQPDHLGRLVAVEIFYCPQEMLRLIQRALLNLKLGMPPVDLLATLHLKLDKVEAAKVHHFKLLLVPVMLLLVVML